MAEDKTIWRDFIPSNFLTEDYFEAGKDRVFTIKAVTNEIVENPKIRDKETKQTLKEEKMVVHFDEDVPPMIFNKTNSRAVQRVTGTPKVSAWIGVQILVYFDPDVKFGKEKVGGLRVRPYPPKEQKPATNATKCSICNQYITAAGAATPEIIAEKSIAEFGEPICLKCWNKKKTEAKNGTEQG